MLTLLRKIRRSLIESSSFQKYLLYAIGEIALVVLGILIALQINNWNNEQQAKKSELLVLHGLLEDFQSNLDQLNNTLDSIPKLIERLNVAVKHFGATENQLTKEIKDAVINSSFATTDLVDGTLQSVLNSDRLDLIRSDKLKQLLTAYPSAVRKFKSSEQIYIQVVIEIQRPMMETFLSLSDLPDPYLKFIGIANVDQVRSRSVPSDFAGLLGNLEYQNTVFNRLWTTNINKADAILLRDRTEEIIRSLKDELERFD